MVALLWVSQRRAMATAPVGDDGMCRTSTSCLDACVIDGLQPANHTRDVVCVTAQCLGTTLQ